MDPVVAAKLAQLRETFISNLPDQLHRYEDALARLKTAAETAAAGVEREMLRQIAHKLAGGAGLHGLMDLSRWGKSTERLCMAGADADALAQAGHAFAELVARITARR